MKRTKRGYCMPIEIEQAMRRRPIMHRLDSKPHLIFHDGKWKLFVSWWKSNWIFPTNHAACISGPDIPTLKKNLEKSRERYRFGYNRRTQVQGCLNFNDA